MSELPAALAAAKPVGSIGFVIEVDGVARLALTPAEVAPLFGWDDPRKVANLIRSGALRARVTHPGSVNARYLIPVSALVEYLAGADEPIVASG